MHMDSSEYLIRAIEHEDTIEWNDDPTRYPYLRQQVRAGHRVGGRVHPGDRWATGPRVVGYAVLLPSALREGRPFYRRLLVCKLADRDGTRTGPPAQEAVDPRQVRPRQVTPWLFDSHDPEPREQWLRDRRSELGLVPDERAALGRPVIRFSPTWS